jgi:hypothetical protein
MDELIHFALWIADIAEHPDLGRAGFDTGGILFSFGEAGV